MSIELIAQARNLGVLLRNQLLEPGQGPKWSLIVDQLIAALEAQQAGGEPVAWRWKNCRGEVVTKWVDFHAGEDAAVRKQVAKAGGTMEYAYTHQAPVQQVDALREMEAFRLWKGAQPDEVLDEWGSWKARAALAAQPAAERPVMSQAAADVLAERARQISAEGWTPEHDDEHDEGELALAAAGYAAAASDHLQAVKHEFDAPGEPTVDDIVTEPRIDLWPHGWEFKASPARRMLVKACGLILADIERLDRAAGITATSGKEGGAA